MPFDPSEYIARPRDWFASADSYDGEGQATFENPTFTVRGSVSVDFRDGGQPTIEMLVSEDLDGGFSEKMLALMGGKRPVVGKGYTEVSITSDEPTVKCTELVVEMSTGEYRTHGGVDFQWRIRDDHNGLSLRLSFHSLSSSFTYQDSKEAKYWIMPITNYIGGFHPVGDVLAQHPMRIHHISVVPDDLPEPDNGIALFNSLVSNRLIAFSYKGVPAYIEPLSGYEQRCKSIKEGDEVILITSVMIGELPPETVGPTDPMQAVPTDLLPILSMVSGNEIGSPWIEFRDEDGSLIRRQHRSIGCKPFTRGRAVVSEPIHRSVGSLLTSIQTTEFHETDELRVVARHLVRSGLSGTSIEERLIHIVRALECLLDIHDIPEPVDLAAQMRKQTLEELTTCINNAAQLVKGLYADATRSGLDDETRVLNQIRQKLNDVMNIRPGFARSILLLLEEYDFPDAMIVNDHYKNHPPPSDEKKWERAIAAYRGEALHKGFIDFNDDLDEVHNLMAIVTHLRDLVIRIVFKMIGYDGTYQPLVEVWTTKEPVDWVKSNTSARRLGYRVS